MKFLKNSDFILHNVWVLFTFFVFTSLLIVYLACCQDIIAILVLFLVGFIVYFFTSNMVIVMFLAIVFTGLIRFTDIGHSPLLHLGSHSLLFEGMEDAAESDDTSTNDSSHNMVSSSSSSSSPSPSSSSPSLPTSSPIEPSSTTTLADLEKLKLQNAILDKIEKLGPLIGTVSSFMKKT